MFQNKQLNEVLANDNLLTLKDSFNIYFNVANEHCKMQHCVKANPHE